MPGVDTSKHPEHWKGDRYDLMSIGFALRELNTLDGLTERLARTATSTWGPGGAYDAGPVMGSAGHLAAAYDADEFDAHALRCVFADWWAPLQDAQAVVDQALEEGSDPRKAILRWLSRLHPTQDRKAA